MPRSKVKFGSLQEFLAHFGNSFNPVFNDEIIRFKQPHHKSKSGWYIARTLGDLMMITAGDYREGDEWHFWCSKSKTTKEDKIEIEKFQKKSIEKHKNLQDEMYHVYKIENQNALTKKTGMDLSSHSYFKKKQIDKNYCAIEIEYEDKKIIAIPMMDDSGEVWNFQRIFEGGQKYFNKGLSKGLFNYIDGNKETVFVCEGFATAVSIHKATGAMTYIAFSVNNLGHVVKTAKSRHKNVVLCADNDAFSEKNVGIDMANQIKAKHKIAFVFPTFKSKEKSPTDFNDLEIYEGIDSVKDQLVSNMDNSFTEYEEYKSVFEKIFSNVKKCAFDKATTGLFKPDGEVVEIENKMSSIKGHCLDVGLETAKVDPYLHKWIDSIKATVQIEIGEADGRDYIGECLSHVNVSNIDKEHFVDLMRQWCAGIWRRYYNPKEQNVCVILKGNQGIGKDTFINNFMGAFGKYYDANFDILEKQSENYQVMSRKMILNIPEFDRTAKINVATIKKLITSDGAFFRAPYSRCPTHHDFRCSFITTANKLDVLIDNTGNRRFWMFVIESIDWGYSKEVSQQILNQSHALYMSDHKASAEALEAVSAYVQSLTPESDEELEEDIVMEWQQRARQAIGAPHLKCVNGKIMPNVAAPIINLLAKDFGTYTNRVRGILKRNGYKKKSGTSRFWVSDPEQHNNIVDIKLPNFAESARVGGNILSRIGEKND